MTLSDHHDHIYFRQIYHKNKYLNAKLSKKIRQKKYDDQYNIIDYKYIESQM